MNRRFVFVVPRFGPNVGGGAETLIRSFVLKLAEHRPALQLEVWTTCALDHRTWNNELPAGVFEQEGYTLRRFSVDQRNLDTFIKRELEMADGKVLNAEEQIEWLDNGVNSKALYQEIVNRLEDVDLFFFAPYLFPPCHWGSRIAGKKAVLVPCLHDEHYAYMSLTKDLFLSCGGIMFNAEPERQLAAHIYGDEIKTLPQAVVGMSFAENNPATNKSPNFQQFKEKGLRTEYILYAGRKEQGKNLDLLINYFEDSCCPEDVSLVLIGSGSIDFRNELPTNVLDFGYVSSEEKELLIKNALALCQPSTNESFSIVLMEAWLMKTAVIVNAKCAVTNYHAEKSGGGLAFSTQEDFVKIVESLKSDTSLRKKLGDSGYQYVIDEYSWEAVERRFFGLVEELL